MLTVINFEMYQASLSTKRYVANDDTQVAADAKAENDFRSQLGELKSRLKKIREALGVETDAIALRVVRQLAAHRAVQPVVERSST